MSKKTDLEGRFTKVLAEMMLDKQLSTYLDGSLKIAEVYRGSGPIRLIILGQDPTVKDEQSRKEISKVLNLKGYGAIHNYLTRICLELGLDLDRNIYATNFVKNFFISPPTVIEKEKKVDVLALSAPYWLPVLRDELAEFPDLPVMTLGLPLLKQIIAEGASPQVRDYWDYKTNWKDLAPVNWRYLEPNQNILNRIVFPMPHQPSYARKPFYYKFLPDYLRFVKNKMADAH